MTNWRAFFAIVAVSLQPLLTQPQSTSTSDLTSPVTRPGSSTGTTVLPQWLPFPIPLSLYQKLRKYGPWDYKQQGFRYRDFTQFNFGGTGSAAGIDQKSLIALAEAAKPTPKDVKSLDNPDLQSAFTRDAEGLDRLRIMAERDSHVVRIAADFTLLDTNSKWPRVDIGFSEARWNEYRSAFKNLSLSEGIVRTEDFPGAIFFVAHGRGLCIGGSSVGYVYSTVPLMPTVESPQEALDAEAHKSSDKHYAYVFKPLKANWYAFYQIDW